MDPRFLTSRRSIKHPVVSAITRGRFFIITSLALLSLSLGSHQAFAQGRPGASQSVSIQLVGVVPARLEMNFTFATGNSVDLVGHGAGATGGFAVTPGATSGLGFMNVKSNLLQGYTVTAWSENGGTMKNLSQTVSVPYRLKIDDRTVECRNGVFKTDYLSRTGKEGDSKFISLQFAEVSDAAMKQVLVDRLTFSISAN